LLDDMQFPATELLEVYLARWMIERVFQQVTEVFHLQRFISSTPQGAIFQFALCGLLYNLIQVVRGYIGNLQQRPAQSLSSEMIFDDVADQMTAASLLLSPEQVVELLEPEPVAQIQTRLSTLLAGQWSSLWIKCPPKKKRPPPAQRAVPGGHSSAWKLIQQAKAKPHPS